MNIDEIYMHLALDKAWEYQGLTYPNPAVGAVVTCNGEIVAVEAHQKAGTSHAEVLALLSAYKKLSNNTIDFDPQDAKKAHDFLLNLPVNFFSECTIYVTLEPCSHQGKTPSCASLLESLHLLRIVIGIKDPIAGHDGGIEIVGRGALTPKIAVGVLKEACDDLIQPFLI